MFNESEAYVFEELKKIIMEPTEKTLLEILERQKKYNLGKDTPKSSSHKKWKLRQDSLDVYKSLSDSDKSKILEELKEEFKKKNLTEEKYKAIMSQESERKSQNEMYKRPYVLVSKETLLTDVPDEAEPTSDEDKTPPTEFKGTVDLIPEDIEGSLFKDNKWENKPESYTNPAIIEELKKSFDAIQDLIEADIKSGGMLIKKIDILSSASRLRNTGDEKLSWLELGKKRSETIALAIGARAKSIEGANDEKIDLIRKKIFLDYFGSNGDGTSGPDPLSPYKRGYYKPDGVFKDEQNGQLKGKKTLDVLVVSYDDSGKQKGSPKLVKAKDLDGNEMSAELKNNKTDYKQFQYNQITVTYNDNYKPGGEDEGDKEDEDKTKTPTPKVVETESVKFEVALKTQKWSKPPYKIDPPNFKPIRNKIRKGWKKLFKSSKLKPFRSVACPTW